MKARSRFRYDTTARLAAAAATLALIAAGEAQAQTDCSSLPSPVYMTGSTAVKPFLAAVAGALRGLSSPITVVWADPPGGSCDGPTKLSTTPSGTITGTGILWNTDGTQDSNGCNLATAGTPVDIGVADVSAKTCGVTVASDVKEYLGPTQTMTFVVPKDSPETAISGEAAYLVFGLGAAGSVSPWDDETLIQVRNDKSGTQRMIGAYIKVPASKFKGTANAGSGNVIMGLTAAAGAGNSAKSIGILATDGADKNRSTLKVLAYQHFGQDCGYLPDTDAMSFDKANVRDGHYMIFGPLHMYAHAPGGTISNENAKKIIDYLSGAVTPEFDLLSVEAKGGVVPDCAMRVKHSDDGGSLMSYMPDKSCECKFLDAAGSKPDRCKSCTQDSDCDKSTPACNFGFCEVK